MPVRAATAATQTRPDGRDAGHGQGVALSTARDGVVVAIGLRKTFRNGRQPIEAVRGLDLVVRDREVFGLLGPNGAGKSSTLRMLTTLLPIDAGRAFVGGVDVVRQPREARRRLGYVGQLGGADLKATGRENLVLQGQLYGASGRDARRRAAELIERLELTSFADRIARTYSGGQRRRLEVALGLMHRPGVLFLDEPTIGLDPQSRAHLWDQLRALRSAGTAIVLTTHYLEEADALADRLAIVDHGQTVAEGTPAELKDRLAAATIVIETDLEPPALEALRAELTSQPAVTRSQVDGRSVRVEVGNATAALAPIAAIVHERGVPLRSMGLARPSLDDVFLHATGRSLRDAGEHEGGAR